MTDAPLPLVRLMRDTSSSTGTFGTLHFDGKDLCQTLEPPWLGNEQGDSCIPDGPYICIPHSGPKFKKVWEVTDVPSREAILIHPGNTIRDTHGCILVGLERGRFTGLPAIVNSRFALELLRKTLPREFQLQITNGFTKEAP